MGDIKGVFFDLHGTLLVSPDLSKAWADWFTAFHTCMMGAGVTLSKQEFTTCLESFFEKPVYKSEDNELSVFERRIKDLSSRLGLELSYRDIHRIAATIIGVWHRDMILDPEVHPVLQSLKPKYKLVLITNWEHPPRIYSLLSELNLRKYFDEVVISAEVGVAKPDPEIFRIALDRTCLQPCEVAYVGDAPIDIEGSLSAGVQPILIQRDASTINWEYNPNTRSTSPENNWTLKIDGIKVMTGLKELLELF
jgi:HAD superfamily hydrolase (TIGR01509 family)